MAVLLWAKRCRRPKPRSSACRPLAAGSCSLAYARLDDFPPCDGCRTGQFQAAPRQPCILAGHTDSAQTKCRGRGQAMSALVQKRGHPSAVKRCLLPAIRSRRLHSLVPGDLHRRTQRSSFCQCWEGSSLRCGRAQDLHLRRLRTVEESYQRSECYELPISPCEAKGNAESATDRHAYQSDRLPTVFVAQRCCN